MSKKKLTLIGTGIVGAAALAAYAFAVRPWHLRWGATDEEFQMPLPGDELTPNPYSQVTHAITINAPAREIYPWLVQIGQGRGGFYSYDWLENLFGLRIHNARRILPEFQQLKVGDFVRAAHTDWLGGRLRDSAGWRVEMVEPNRAVVLRGAIPADEGTWTFVLNPIDERTTRLIIRARSAMKPSLLGSSLMFLIGEPTHFIMERKMLLNLKENAEAAS